MSRLYRVVACVSSLIVCGCSGASQLKIEYSLKPVLPSANTAASTHVVIRVSGVKSEKTLRLQMPVWSPGDYHVQNHAKYVQQFTASEDLAKPLSFEHPDQNTWSIQTGGKDVVVAAYDIPNVGPGYFSENAKVTDKFAFYNGPAVYMYVEGHKADPVRLSVVLAGGWKDALAALDRGVTMVENSTIVSFTAADYDTLADSPVLAGDFEKREFTAAGRKHTLAFFRNQAGMDFDSYVPVVRKFVEEENRLMGGPPYKQYVFFFDVGGPGGGLEHLNGTRIAIGKNMPARFLAGTGAHEFFHCWNVKRIRPEVLGPFDYINPPKTRNLWFSEGVTSYYGDLSCCRAGLTSQEDYLGGLGRTIAFFNQRMAKVSITVDDSSYRVWEANNSSGYGGVNYYLKGELIGLCLDLKIRGLTQNRKSLDDFMRDMIARYGLPKPGFPEDGIRDAVILAGGPEMGPFYDRLCRTTEAMPFAECLQYAGLALDEQGKIQGIPNVSVLETSLQKSWLTGK